MPVSLNGISPSLINAERMANNFIAMARINTVSDESKADTDQVPSTEEQKILAEILRKDLEKTCGLRDVKVDKSSVVTAFLPSNLESDKNIPTIGLFAHMDIADDVPTDNIQPTIHKNYQGGDLILGHGIVIPSSELTVHISEDIITTDGRTLLGADDKAGIAEILEVLRFYDEHPELKRPNIKVGFTVDEEIGRGMDFFNIQEFGADAAYTIDGSVPGEIESETFNAHMVKIKFKGTNVHPGYAKGKMVNSLRALADFITLLPRDEAPETTEGRQGYIHPTAIEDKSVEQQSSLTVIVRDFDYENSLRRLERIRQIAKEVERLNPGCSIEINIKEQYRNMKEFIARKPEVVEYAKKGIEATGLEIIDRPIRGGTDGSSLSLRGLPTPNLAAGGHNFHSLREFVTIQDMQKCAATIINTLSAWVEAIKK